jgi:putative DNA primase/helicase
MMFIIGNGGEGKSRIGIVLQKIFKNAMVTGNFQRIETDKFFRYNLKNKLIMVDDDMQMTALPSMGYIKNLVTAEIPVDVEAKGRQSEQAKLYSRFLCFGNGSPRALYDKSDGFARRLLILTTKAKPPNRTPDPYLAEKFIAEKEKIFCWMFDGLKRLIANNFRFTLSEKTKRNVAEVMADNCNIIEFLADDSYIRFGADLQASCNDLYGGYFQWCSRNALTALKRETFVNWLRNNETKYSIKYSYHVPSHDGGHVRGFKGIHTSYVPIVT